jgi:hypothetical protein
MLVAIVALQRMIARRVAIHATRIGEHLPISSNSARERSA